MQDAYESLTIKQQRFVDYFIESGNATDSARRAGYGGNDVTLGAVGAENLKKPQIQAALKERQGDTNKKRIASADDVLEFLTETMGDIEQPGAVRVRAAELLGKRYLLWKEQSGDDPPDLNGAPYDPGHK